MWEELALPVIGSVGVWGNLKEEGTITVCKII